MNALVRHPVLRSDPLVVSFLTEPVVRVMNMTLMVFVVVPVFAKLTHIFFFFFLLNGIGIGDLEKRHCDFNRRRVHDKTADCIVLVETDPDDIGLGGGSGQETITRIDRVLPYHGGNPRPDPEAFRGQCGRLYPFQSRRWVRVFSSRFSFFFFFERVCVFFSFEL